MNIYFNRKSNKKFTRNKNEMEKKYIKFSIMLMYKLCAHYKSMEVVFVHKNTHEKYCLFNFSSYIYNK